MIINFFSKSWLGEEDDELEVKQTQVSQYESMQISAILQKSPVDKDVDSSSPEPTEGTSCLVCIARRVGFGDKSGVMLGVEQFTTKQDLTGKVLKCDIRWDQCYFVGMEIFTSRASGGGNRICPIWMSVWLLTL